MLDAGAVAVGYDFVFAYSADTFSDPSTGEKRLRGFDLPFQRYLYQNRGRVFIAHTEIGVPHRSFTAAAGEGGVRSVIVSTDSDGVVRRHVPEVPLQQSPHLIDALMGMAGADISEAYTSIPSARLATSVPYISLVDVLDLLKEAEGRQRLEELAGDGLSCSAVCCPMRTSISIRTVSCRTCPMRLPRTVRAAGPGSSPRRRVSSFSRISSVRP